jgi:hypothetical protein
MLLDIQLIRRDEPGSLFVKGREQPCQRVQTRRSEGRRQQSASARPDPDGRCPSASLKFRDFLRFFHRAPQVAELIHQSEIERLRTQPYAPSGDGF